MAASTVSTPTEAPDAVVRAHVTSLRLMLAGWITHFRSLGYIKESTMHLLDKRICKTTADLTGRNPKVREAIGVDSKVWNDLVDLFRAAMPSLEHRSYASIDPVHATYDGPNSNAIVGNSVSLLKDLQRLDNMLAMARNILTSGEKVQNLAAQVGFDREVCSMINLCIKITARGYDGDGSAVDEDKWQGVINGFKKLLITSLQFLSNLVTLNERLKLMLWVELFDSSSESLHAVSPPAEPAAPHHEKGADSWVRAAVDDFKQLQKSPDDRTSTVEPALPTAAAVFDSSLQKITMPSAFSLWAGYERSTVEKSLADKQGAADPQHVVEALEYVWQNMPTTDRVKWDRLHEEKIVQIQKRFEQYTSTGGTLTAAVMEKAMVELGMIDSNKPAQPASQPAKPDNAPRTDQTQSSDHFWKSAAMDTAADGARKLDEGKAQLLRRLEHAPADREQQKEYEDSSPPPLPPPQPQLQVQGSAPPEAHHRAGGNRANSAVTRTPERKVSDQPEDDEFEADEDDEDEDDDEADEDNEVDDEEDDEEDGEDDDLDDEDEDEEDESSEEEEDDYAIPGEDGRGLLTDVPLILGPNEIEVLPMIIMSGIVASPSEMEALSRSTAETDHVVNMYTIRCHLLLAQENGRNLLRELLIFVAAWDLREEELYFKFMVKIMEAILLNGLMPFAYGAFKESKDIISPAQAVIMKLLTKIFHSRQGFIAGAGAAADSRSKRPGKSVQRRNSPEEPALGQRYDVQIVHCLFSEFRQNIIPQICALIFLQGQIRAGHAHLEDFPLNLWDMERMYEGVYQYLEFFAILTDHDQWKQLMAEWEVTSELLTLLKELEVAIPKGKSQPATPPPPETPLEAPKRAGPVPVAVERPYDVTAAGAEIGYAGTATATNTPSTTAQTPVESDQHSTKIGVDDAGDGSGQQGAAATPPPPPPQQQQTYPEPLHDEPADFEWRNLKKLCILVLSSLVWKSSVLQDQVRRFNGITTILACCSHDEHNPYIREHAIMCLRFLLEGNPKNQEVIKGLAEGWVDVPRRVAEGSSSLTALTGGVGESNEAAGASEDEEVVRVRSKLAVPAEVLDQQGYETFVDAKGQVGLRRKESPSATDKAAAAAAQVAQAHGRAAASIEEIKTVHNGGKRTGLLEPGTGNFPDWLNMVMKSNASRQG